MFYVLSVNVVIINSIDCNIHFVTTNHYPNLVGSCIFFLIVMDN